jgi:DNA-binding MarR family transcriptional regulator
MILVALAEFDLNEGVEIGVVSEKLQVNSSFVMVQSRVLEKRGFLRRQESSLRDAGVVRIALTDRAREALTQFSGLGPNPPS